MKMQWFTVKRADGLSMAIYDHLNRVIATTVGLDNIDNRLGSPTTLNSIRKNAYLIASAPDMQNLLKDIQDEMPVNLYPKLKERLEFILENSEDKSKDKLEKI